MDNKNISVDTTTSAKQGLKEVLKMLDGEFFRARLEISSAALQKAQAELIYNSAVQKAFDAERRLNDKIKETADLLGVNLSEAHWRLDIDNMEFHKLEDPKSS